MCQRWQLLQTAKRAWTQLWSAVNKEMTLLSPFNQSEFFASGETGNPLLFFQTCHGEFTFFQRQGLWMVLQKLWVSQNFSRISRVSQSHFVAVMCVSQSRFLYEAVSESRFFARLRVSKSWFVCLPVFVDDFFSSLDIEFQWSNLQISEKKLILTSPKLSEFHKKLQNLPQRPFWGRKTVILF